MPHALVRSIRPSPRPGLRLVHGLTVALVTFGAATARADLADDLPIGAGYAAADLCTRTMQSGDQFDRVRDDYTAPIVQPLPLLWRIDVQPLSSVTVSANLGRLSVSRTAIFRPGLGCTVVPPGSSEAEVRAQPFTPPRLPVWTPLAWPLGDAPAQSWLATAPQQALLLQHADAAFAEATDPSAPRQNTIAFLVAHDGHLLFERYGPGYVQAQPQLGWSMTKSLTALVAGVLAGEGRLQLDQPVLQRFAGTPKQAITWRHLLHMSSGLEWDEGYGGNSDVTRMLVSAADAGSYTADKPLLHAPGSVFNYSTGDATLAMLGMRELLGGSSQALFQAYQNRLFAPLGIRNAVVEQDASGTPVGGARGVLRPRDWLRLGQLVLDDGWSRGRRVVPSDFLGFIKTPSPAYDGYGGYVWLHKATPAELQPRLPTDLLWFAGHLGQYVVILPTQKLMVLRMGVSQDTAESERRLFSAVADLVDALKQAR